MVKEGQVRIWWREPSSWVAMIGAAISIGTFVLVQANPGSLVVVVPDRVSIRLPAPVAPQQGGTGGSSEADDTLSLLLPLTLTNTGAPRTWKHVTRVLATLTPSRPEQPGGPVDLVWEFEHRFVGEHQFRKEHPDVPVGNADYLAYDGRALPFALKGGDTTTKLFELQARRSEGHLSSLATFDLAVAVETSRGRKLKSRRFHCRALSSRDFQWCSIDEHEPREIISSPR